MKLLIFNLFILLFALVFTFMPKEALAKAPIVSGSVRTEDGTGIAGVWVKWTDLQDRNADPDAMHSRYAQTDGNGYFSYPSWDGEDFKSSTWDTFIDPNLDGKADTRLSSVGGGSSAFGCGEWAHKFEVVQPVNDTGTYSKITGVTFGNGEYNKDVGIITYEPQFRSIIGSKVQMPGNTKTGLIDGQEVVLDDTETKTDNPFSFSVLPGTHTITAKAPVNYQIGFTLCQSANTCHNDAPVMKNTVTFDVPATGSTSLWWHYFPPGTIVPTATPPGVVVTPGATITPGATTIPQPTVSAYIKTSGGNVHSNQ